MKSALKQSFSREAILALEGAQRNFQTWRQDRSLPNRIPEGLWQEAVNLVGLGLSVHRVARTLKLDHNHLKRRSHSQQNACNSLVEIPMPMMFPQPGISPLAEITSPTGFVLRIFSLETSAIVRTFLEQ